MYLKGCSHGPWWPHCGGRSRGLSYCTLNHLTIKTHSYTEGWTCDPWVLDDAGLLGWQGQDWWSDWARPMVPYWVDPWHKWCLKLYIFNMLVFFLLSGTLQWLTSMVMGRLSGGWRTWSSGVARIFIQGNTFHNHGDHRDCGCHVFNHQPWS